MMRDSLGALVKVVECYETSHESASECQLHSSVRFRRFGKAISGHDASFYVHSHQDSAQDRRSSIMSSTVHAQASVGVGR